MQRSLHSWFAAVGRLFLLAAVLGCGTRSAVAGFVGIITPSDPAIGQSAGNFTLGYEFETGPSSYPVSALGVWDEATGTPFLSANHVVGIYDTVGNLLTSTTVPAAATPANQIGAYAYTFLGTPLMLTANTDYILVTESNNDDAFHNTNALFLGPVFNTPSVNYVQRESIGGGNGSLQFPVGQGGDLAAWDAPNLFSNVPEPASVVLFAVGGLFLLARSLRKIQ